MKSPTMGIRSSFQFGNEQFFGSPLSEEKQKKMIEAQR
jgi:hypothetical protein